MVSSQSRQETARTTGAPQSQQDLRDTDVICARTKLAHNHPGNKRYQVITHEYRASYQGTSVRREKSRIVQELIKSIETAGCRFVRFNKDAQIWEPIDEKTKYEKVSHALRSAKESKTKGAIRATSAAAAAPAKAPAQPEAEHEEYTSSPPACAPVGVDPLPVRTSSPTSSFCENEIMFLSDWAENTSSRDETNSPHALLQSAATETTSRRTTRIPRKVSAGSEDDEVSSAACSVASEFFASQSLQQALGDAPGEDENDSCCSYLLEQSCSLMAQDHIPIMEERPPSIVHLEQCMTVGRSAQQSKRRKMRMPRKVSAGSDDEEVSCAASSVASEFFAAQEQQSHNKSQQERGFQPLLGDAEKDTESCCSSLAEEEQGESLFPDTPIAMLDEQERCSPVVANLEELAPAASCTEERSPSRLSFVEPLPVSSCSSEFCEDEIELLKEWAEGTSSSSFFDLSQMDGSGSDQSKKTQAIVIGAGKII